MQMLIAARMAVQRWQSNPKLSGEPCFALFSEEPVLHCAPFRHQLVATMPDGYVFAIHAQDILDLLDEDPKIAIARAQLESRWH